MTDKTDLRCAKCGIALAKAERAVAAYFHSPGGCESHLMEVLNEATGNRGMWPHGWYGHWMINGKGYWHPLPATAKGDS